MFFWEFSVFNFIFLLFERMEIATTEICKLQKKNTWKGYAATMLLNVNNCVRKSDTM